MVFRPDRLLLAGALALLSLAPLGAAPADDALAEAKAALERGDGIAAELAGKRALEQGARRADAAAFIGEGELLQGDLADARRWLSDEDFAPESRTRGLHALARLYLAEEDYAAAMAVFDRMLAEGRESARLWVDIGRMRYRLGMHHQALEAATKAVALGKDDPRALELQAQLVRDAAGLRSAIPLFRKALEKAPDDLGLMQQMAATLGDAGEYVAMLETVRQLVEKHGPDPFAFYLQAVLAARAGKDELARSLLWQTEGRFNATAAGLVLSGVLEYRSGNPAVAAEHFNALRRMQPFNETAALLYARALVANGEANVALAILEPRARRADASAYVLVLTARALEQLGQREEAAQYLDRAALMQAQPLAAVPAYLERDASGRLRDPDNPLQQLRQMLNEGDTAGAQAMIAGLLERFAGSADLEVLAGDVALLAGDREQALEYYRQAAIIRRDWPLVQRLVAALGSDSAAARGLLAEHLAEHPLQEEAAALLGRLHAQAGNRERAAMFLRHAAAQPAGRRDPLLLADLALLEQQSGHGGAALARAQEANRLARSNRHVARVLSAITAMQQGGVRQAASLLAKAEGTGFSARGAANR